VSTVETARGPVDVADLGFTLMHEHLLHESPSMHDQWPHLEDLDARADDVAGRVREAGGRGVRTIVDCTAPNMGRDVPRIARIAEQTDVNIIFATGLHPHFPVPYPLVYKAPKVGMDAGRIAELFIRDLTVGYGDTGVKAGVIKVGTDPEMDRANEIVLRAAAQAQLAAGAPITTHTRAKAKVGLMQQDVFEAEGVDLGRVVIGHCGDSTDFAYLTALCERGSFIGMDRFGLDAPPWFRLSIGQRIDVVVEMCRRGYASHMVLSHDSMCWCDFISEEDKAQYMPKSRLTTVSDEVIPVLLDRVGPEAVELMTVTNPRRVFSGKPE
jgi:phosphotriesterase-related protein